MESGSPLEDRLRTARYREAAEACGQVLDGIGVPEERRRLLALAEVDKLWPMYLSRLRAGGDARERWPADHLDDVRRRIDELRMRISGTTVVWLALSNSQPVGIEVPADTVLGAGLTYLVSPAGDLMLTTHDATDGACIELNHMAAGDEYEIVTWGRFSQ